MSECAHIKEVHMIRVEVCPTCEPFRCGAMRQSRGQQLAAIIRKVNWGDGCELPSRVVQAADSLANYLECRDTSAPSIKPE